MADSPPRPLRLEITILVFTVILSGAVSWIVSFYQTESAKKDKRLESKMACFDRVVKNFTEYRDSSMIYFFDYIAGVRGETTSGSDGKHAEYHNQEAELQTCLEIIPLLFDEPVKKKAEELTEYLGDNPWEQIVQSRAFVDEARQINQANSDIDSITTLITLRTDYENYLTLTRDLTALMAEEIAPGHSNGVRRYPSVNGYCSVSHEEARVGEIVTFTAHGKGGSGYFVYTWKGDDGLESLFRTVRFRYSQPGTKHVTLRIVSNGQSIERSCHVTVLP